MKDKKVLLTLIIGVIIGICAMGITVYATISKINLVDEVYTAKVNTENKKEDEFKEEKPVEITESNETEVIVEKNEQVKSKRVETKKVETKKIEEEQEVVEEIDVIETSSDDIIFYAEDVEKRILAEENVKSALGIAKSHFIKITDFIFYGTEINGYTFDDLTEEAKLHLMNIAIRIDARLEEKNPNYKEQINLNIRDINNKLTIKYLEVSDKICTKLGSAACNQAREDFRVLKEDVGLTIDLLKVILTDSLDSLKSWYELFRES